MHVIWARGQEYGEEVHDPEPHFHLARQPNFYRRDELKYHGHGAQRGVASINFQGTANALRLWVLASVTEGNKHSMYKIWSEVWSLRGN